MKQVDRWNRRNFLATLSGSMAALWPGKLFAWGRQEAGGSSLSASSSATRNIIYDELGVNTIINGWGTITVIGGSIIPPEVMAAMDAASRHFVSIPELLEATGDRIAKMLKGLPPDHTATVTSGAAGAIQCGVSGCSRERIRNSSVACLTSPG